ncbi:MAG: hypothetical protein ACTHLT_09465 [Devosia sp.]
MSDLVYNERTKLLANALDRASTACVAVGGIAPVVAVGVSINVGSSVLGAVIRLFAAITLHFIGRMVLGRLRG